MCVRVQISLQRELMGIAVVKSEDRGAGAGGGKWVGELDKPRIKCAWSMAGGRVSRNGPDVQLGYKMSGACLQLQPSRCDF